MKIYTGRGDEGMTDLMNGTRISKTSGRIEAYGTIDELNALLGVIRPTGYDDLDEQLGAIQNHLHIIQAEFANPEPDADTPTIRAEHIDQLESWIDALEADLDPLDSFILPSGSDAGAQLHHARAVCRRTERRAVAFVADDPVDDNAIVYLNRLSDYLFVLARTVNAREGIPEESPTY